MLENIQNHFCRFQIDKIRFIFRPVFSRSRGVSYDSEPTNVVQGDRGGDGGADAGAKYRWFHTHVDCKLQKQRGSTAVVV